MIRDIDERKAPLLDHLIELRRRLLWCVAALFGSFFVCLYFAQPIFGFLVQPLLAAGQGKLAGKIVRIGHMGLVSKADINAAIEALDAALGRLGYKKPAAVG